MYKLEPSFPKAHYVLEWEDAGDIPIKLKLPFNSDFKLVLSQLFPAFLNCISFSSKVPTYFQRANRKNEALS